MYFPPAWLPVVCSVACWHADCTLADENKTVGLLGALMEILLTWRAHSEHWWSLKHPYPEWIKTVVKSLEHHSFNVTVPSTSVFLRYNCTNALTGSVMSVCRAPALCMLATGQDRCIQTNHRVCSIPSAALECFFAEYGMVLFFTSQSFSAERWVELRENLCAWCGGKISLMIQKGKGTSIRTLQLVEERKYWRQTPFNYSNISY